MNFTKKANKELALAMKDQILKRTELLRNSKMYKGILKRKEEDAKKDPDMILNEGLDLEEVPGFVLLKGVDPYKKEMEFTSLFIGSADGLDFLSLELYQDHFDDMEWKVNDFPEDDYIFRPATEKECISFFVQLKKFQF